MLIRHCLYRETSERNVTSETVEPLMGHSSEVSFLGQYSHIRHHRGGKFACFYSFSSHFLFARGAESKLPYPNGIWVYSGSPWAPSDSISTPTQVLINTQKQQIWPGHSKDHFWWPIWSILHYTTEEPALWATSLFSSLFSLTLISTEWFLNALQKTYVLNLTTPRQKNLGKRSIWRQSKTKFPRSSKRLNNRSTLTTPGNYTAINYFAQEYLLFASSPAKYQGRRLERQATKVHFSVTLPICTGIISFCWAGTTAHA